MNYFPEKILSSTFKHYGIYGITFPMLNLERYDSWCKQLTKEAEVKFNQMIEETISNRLVCLCAYLYVLYVTNINNFILYDRTSSIPYHCLRRYVNDKIFFHC